MKKLPFCALSAGALFVIFGVCTIVYLAPHPEPFGLLFPLLWDMAMVSIGLGVIFRCAVARKAGFIWSIFCLIASLAVAAAAFLWILPQYPESVGLRRLTFMTLTVGFGVLFGIWQLFILRSPTALAWSSHTAGPESPDHSGHVRHS